MSYLDDQSHEVQRTDAAAFYVIDRGAADTQLGAEEFAVRIYRRNARYTGPVHTVCNPVEDDWRVMVMEEDGS